MQRLVSLSLDITERCNLNCSHCAISENSYRKRANELQRNEISFTDICRIIDKARQLGCRDIVIGGGEPFLHPDIFKILEIIARNKMHCAILTNGTLLNDDNVSKLAELKFWISYIRVSLDNADQEKFDTHRGGIGLFEKVKEGINKLKDKGFNLGIGMSLIPSNINEIGDVISLAAELVDFVRVVPVMPIGRALKFNIDEDFWVDALSEITKALINLDREYSSEYMPIPTSFNEIFMKFCQCCPAGIITCTVSSDGYVRICPGMYILSEEHSWKRHSLIEIWQDIIQSVMNIRMNYLPNIIKGRCRTCSQFMYCRGGCLVEMAQGTENLATYQPVCIASVIERSFADRLGEPNFRKLLSGCLSRQNFNLEMGINPCMRSSPLWVYPFIGHS